MGSKSFYLKVFFAIRNIIIITIIILYTLSLSLAFIHFKNENLKSARYKIHLLKQELDYYADSLQYYSRLLSGNPVIQSSMRAYSKNPFLSSEKLAMSMEIGRLILPIPHIYSATIYDTEGDIVISSESSPKALDFDLKTKGVWISSDKKDFGDNIHHAISYIRPFYNYNSGDLLGYMELSISDKHITDIYQILGTKSEQYLIVDEKRQIFSHSGNSLPEDKMQDILNRYQSQKVTVSKDFFIYSDTISSLNLHAIYLLPIKVLLSEILRLAIFFILLLAILLILAVMASKNLSRSILKPLYRVIDKIADIKESKDLQVLEYRADISDINLLIQAFNDMVISQNKLKQEISEIHFRLLNEQIKPHFLYNTLENISALADLDEKEKLTELISNLSGFYRLVLGRGQAFITIYDEIKTIEAYMNIMNIRYMDKFSYKIHCDSTLYHYACPKLILQPLVENSIYHGMKGISYKGFVEIRIADYGEDIGFAVMDNGIGLQNDSLQANTDSFAIRNIRSLLQLYYGDGYDIHIGNNQDRGCRAEFFIRKEKHFETEHNHSG